MPPLYEYECPKCAHAQDLCHTMAECDQPHACPKCKAKMHRLIGVPRAIKPPPDMFWEMENGGRGREITQFCGNKFKPGDPRNKRFFRSQRELLETCKRENYSVERTR